MVNMSKSYLEKSIMIVIAVFTITEIKTIISR